MGSLGLANQNFQKLNKYPRPGRQRALATGLIMLIYMYIYSYEFSSNYPAVIAWKYLNALSHRGSADVLIHMHTYHVQDAYVYTCMYILKYVYIYICMYIYMYIYLNAYMYTIYTYRGIYVYIYVCYDHIIKWLYMAVAHHLVPFKGCGWCVC